MVKLLYMGKNYLSIKSSINLYQALVRCLLEYGSEIWGFHYWNEGEQIQYQMAKRILHASATTCQEVLLGELGWYKLRVRRIIKKLIYWYHVVTSDTHRTIYQIYKATKMNGKTNLVVVP